MNKINRDTPFIDVLNQFEECLDLDKELHNQARYKNYKYGVSKMKEFLEDRPLNVFVFEDHHLAFLSFYSFNHHTAPFDTMIISDLKDIMDVYIFNIERNNDALIDKNKITKVLDNHSEYMSVYYNSFKNINDDGLAGQITNNISGEFLKCQVPKGEKIEVSGIYPEKMSHTINFNEGEEFIVIARKGSFTVPTVYGNCVLTDKDNKELNYATIGAFMYAKTPLRKEKLKISSQSSIEDIVKFRENNIGKIEANIHIPLHWIKNRYIQVSLNDKEYFVPITIGAGNEIKDFLLDSKKNLSDFELLTRMYNGKALTDEQSKYLIDSKFELCNHMNGFSNQMKEYIVELGNFRGNEELYRKLDLQQSEKLDELLFNSGVGLKFLKNIGYEPSLESIKKHLQREGADLEYVKIKTPELCEISIKSRGTALRFIKEQNLELCKLAVSQDKKAIKYVNKEFLKQAEEYLNGLESVKKSTKNKLK